MFNSRRSRTATFLQFKILKRKGIDPIVISFSKGDHWEKKIRNLLVRVININNYKNPFTRLLKIIFVLKKHRIDIVQSQHFFTNIYTYFSSKALGIRGIGTVRSDVFNGDIGNGINLWRKIVSG